MRTATILVALRHQLEEAIDKVRAESQTVTVDVSPPRARTEVEDQLLAENREIPVSVVWIYANDDHQMGWDRGRQVVRGYRWTPAVEPLLKLRTRLEQYLAEENRAAR